MDKIRKIIRFVKRLFPKLPKMKFIYAWYYKHGKINEKQALFESFLRQGCVRFILGDLAGVFENAGIKRFQDLFCDE